MITYSKSNRYNNAFFGKIETPIKMIIEHQSDLYLKKPNICNMLFNVERSYRYGETIIGENELNVFYPTEEGKSVNQDNIFETYRKFIEHIQFMKEFAITAEMIEDAQSGIAADAKRRAENFVRAYYKTINKLCESALANGIYGSMDQSGTMVDITTSDTRPLFHNFHLYAKNTGTENTQSNYFYGDIFSTEISGTRTPSVKVFEEALAKLTITLRNMKDENGDPLGYEADTLILPGNKPTAEWIAKKVCGTASGLDGDGDDINLHYGKWNIVILPSWQPENDSVMIMSSEANKNLCGNMFFNRVPLTVSNFVDHHTGNYIWNGRCRFGVGFGNYKHILLAVDSASEVAGASAL